MTYGVFPVMGRNKVPARHPQNLAVHFFHECDHIGTEALDVIGGHKRDSAHTKAALTLTNNFKPRAGGIDVRIEFEVNGFPVFGGRDSLGNGLSIAPAHSDRYFHTTIGPQYNAAVIGNVGSEREFVLYHAALLRAVQRKYRAVLTDIGFFCVRALGGPRAYRVPLIHVLHGAAALGGLWLRLFD